MKKSLCFLAVIVALGAFSLRAALLYEPFDYAAGQLLTTATPSWYLNGTGDDTYVVPGSLSIAGLAPSLGNSITNGGAGAAVRIALPSTNSSGSLYYSFALRVDDVGSAFTSTTSFIAAFVQGASTYGARLMPRRVDDDTYNLGVTKVSASAAVWAPDNFADGQTLFIVGRYTFNTGSTTDDAVDLWINPSPGSFGAGSPPAPTLTATLTGTDLSLIDQFTFRQNTSGNTPAAMTFDELRIGFTWADVTPVPEPAAVVLLGLGLLWCGVARPGQRG